MIGMLQNKLQALNIIRTEYRRMYVDVVEFNVDKLRLCVDVERMYVSRR